MDQTQTGVVGSEPAPVRTMIVKAQQPDAAKNAALAAKMWDHPTEALAAEFASDCELTNKDSLRFHRGLGFTEANRIICFTKKIPETPSEESV